MSSALRHLGLGFGYALPLGLFVYYLAAYAYNAPEADDYFAIFGFLNDFLRAETGQAKWQPLFGNIGEHRIVFGRLVYLATTWATGHVDLRWMIWLGNALYLTILVVLYRIFPTHPAKKWLFIPVLFFVLQQQYSEVTFSAVQSSQHNVVFLWVLLAVYCLARPGVAWLAAAVLLGLVATYTNGNGMLVWLAGLGQLAFARQGPRAGAWLLASLAWGAAHYFSLEASGQSGTWAHVGLDLGRAWPFALRFIGSLAHVSAWGHWLSGGLALGLLALYAWWGLTGYAQRNPANFGFMLFLLLSVGAITLGRSGLGYAYRYNIYSAFFVSTAYLAAVGEWPRLMHKALPISLIISAITCLFSYFDYTEFILALRREKLANAYNLPVHGFALMDFFRKNKLISSGLHFGHQGVTGLISTGHYDPPSLGNWLQVLAQEPPPSAAAKLQTELLAGGKLQLNSLPSWAPPPQPLWITLRRDGRTYVLTTYRPKNRLLNFLRHGIYEGDSFQTVLLPNSLPGGFYRLGLLTQTAEGVFAHQDAGGQVQLPEN
jgi:hypothetical protein